MSIRALSAIEISVNVRRVFVRHQIDIGKMSLRVCRGVVFLQGDLVMLPGTVGDLSPADAGAIFDEIRRCLGITGMTIDLRNWTHNGYNTDWRPVKVAMHAKPLSGGNSVGQTLDLDKEAVTPSAAD